MANIVIEFKDWTCFELRFRLDFNPRLPLSLQQNFEKHVHHILVSLSWMGLKLGIACIYHNHQICTKSRKRNQACEKYCPHLTITTFVRMCYLDVDSQADFKAALERSLSTRQPGREGINNEFFERNTPRSKSLGRGLKGTCLGWGGSHTWWRNSHSPSGNNSLSFRDLWTVWATDL